MCTNLSRCFLNRISKTLLASDYTRAARSPFLGGSPLYEQNLEGPEDLSFFCILRLCIKIFNQSIYVSVVPNLKSSKMITLNAKVAFSKDAVVGSDAVIIRLTSDSQSSKNFVMLCHSDNDETDSTR